MSERPLQKELQWDGFLKTARPPPPPASSDFSQLGLTPHGPTLQQPPGLWF
ncbi:hypothetical protein E4U23_006453 [Claviceps purpurea]|nr:hypothetical protein E4U23_006453 [Claviceps purpurea]